MFLGTCTRRALSRAPIAVAGDDHVPLQEEMKTFIAAVADNLTASDWKSTARPKAEILCVLKW